MPYLNNCTIVGPMRNKEFRVSASGNPWITFTICHKPWSKDKDKQPDTLFLKCIAFGKPAEWLAEAAEDAHVIVSGELRANNYTDKDGNERKNVELHCRDAYAFDYQKFGNGNKPDLSKKSESSDSDIPF